MKHLVLALILLAATNGAAHAAKPAIGHITALKGHVESRDNDARGEPQIGEKVFENAKFITGKDGFLTIEFIDHTEITMGNNAEIFIDKYIFDPADNTKNSAVYWLTKGAFHYISGLIAKKPDPDVTLNLDFGSIGIRGTEIWRDMIPDDDGKPMCRIYIEDGKADVFNEKGKVTLGNGEGTKIKGLEIAPTPAKPWEAKAIADIKAKTQF